MAHSGGGTLIRQKKNNLVGHTFDHLGCRDGIRSMLQVAGSIVKHEQALGKAICLALEDINRVIDLCNKLLHIEISATVLSWFENDVGLFAGRSIKSEIRYKIKRCTCCHHAGIPTQMLRNPRPSKIACRLLVWGMVVCLDDSNRFSIHHFDKMWIHHV